MQVKHMQWHRNNPLTQRYVDKHADVLTWFDWHPSQPAHIEQRAKHLDDLNSSRADRTALVEALLTYNRKIDNHPKAIQAIEQLRDKHTLVVVGGQQPGLLSGELLVIYKAAQVIQQARQASQQLHRPVVPVFWIAGDDHDWDEVDHAYVSGIRQGVTKIQLPIAKRSRLPFSFVSLTQAQFDAVYNQLAASLPDSAFKSEVLQMYQTCFREGESLSDSFARLLAKFAGEHGLILLDAADKNIRRIEVPFFKHLIQNTSEIQQCVLERSLEVKNAGYTPQVEVQQDQANLFIVHNEERRLLYHADNGYTDKHKKIQWSKSELIDIAEKTPWMLSNNVVTRPLMQEYLLPVLGCVLGPAELAYWALYQTAFHHLGMNMPILYPRTEWTIIEPIVAKQMERFQVSMETAMQRNLLVSKRDLWLVAQDDVGIERRFQEVKNHIATLYDPLLHELAELPGIMDLGQINKSKIEEQLRYLQKKAELALRQKHETNWRRWNVILESIVPLGKPQERVYNIADYLAKYGVAWVHLFIAAADTDYEHHHLLYM